VGFFDIRPSSTVLEPERRAELLESPGWGKVFTDHMITIRYSPDRGWHDAALDAYRPLPMHPSASVLNYGQAIFEGLKAYRQPDGSVAAFRPDKNAERFVRSARRLAMPELPVELFLESLRLLVAQDRHWVPARPGESLYLRPLMLATDEALMTRPSAEYLYVLFASPVADYFPGGVRPVSVWLCREYIRAAPGGTGEAKFAGNYAAAMIAQREAAAHGCDQVVWLDATRHQNVEEMGGMNLFFVTSDNQLVTPPLTGTLLPGVTRDSVLTLGRDLGLTVEERTVTVEEWRAGAEAGAIPEVFACGTAAVVTPVGQVKYAGGSFRVADGEPGKLTMTLRSTLLGIQEGTSADPYGWRFPLCP
jgi:branched-chain amino acid aminotransferase